MKLSGVFVANVTPFLKSEAVDLGTYARHLEWLADAGVHGFVPCGTTGEGSVLGTEDRTALLKATVEIARQRKLRVIAGCGSNDTAAALEHIENAAKLGCDAALVVT